MATVDELALEIEEALREDYEALCNYGTPLLAAQAAKEDVADFKAACLSQGRAEGMEKAAEIERTSMARITGLSELKLSLMQNDGNREILEKMLANARAEGAEGVMSCPLYSHGWANDDDRQGEVHCCDRKGHEMSWNPAEMNDELKRAGIDPASVLVPKVKP